MKRLIIALAGAIFAFGCANEAPKRAVSNTVDPIGPAASPTPAANVTPSPSAPKNGDYPGKGVVTKLNTEIGSVEMDHEEIKGVMPPMRMEFYVSDKQLLDGLAVGDKVEFTLRYKNHTETIVAIRKAR